MLQSLEADHFHSCFKAPTCRTLMWVSQIGFWVVFSGTATGGLQSYMLLNPTHVTGPLKAKINIQYIMTEHTN